MPILRHFRIVPEFLYQPDCKSQCFPLLIGVAAVFFEQFYQVAKRIFQRFVEFRTASDHNFLLQQNLK